MTLFHGLPSDRVRAIAQGPDGSMWFGTEAGLAKFDGRRTQAIIDSELPAARVLALKTDDDGVLWIGTDSGAARLVGGKFASVRETAGKVVTAIITPERGRAVMATEQGMIFECHKRADGTFDVQSLLGQPLASADKDHPGPLVLTSLTIAHDKLFAGSLSRGMLAIEDGSAKTTQMRPEAYFIRALETDAHGRLLIGARSRKEESGFYRADAVGALSRGETPTGTVMAICATGEEVWVGTDGRGVFRFNGPGKVQRFTFDGTAGGLRSDHIYSIFADREQVVWFGTDRGVCRYDPHAARVESVGNNAESNFVRTLFQASDGRILAGTNRGLFVYDQAASVWQPVAQLARNIIYSVAEDNTGRLLIGSASGFYRAQKPASGIRTEEQIFTRVEASSGNADAIGSIRAIKRFRGGVYIASYGRGVELFDHERGRIIWPKDSAGTREVISLATDGDVRLLIGTTNDGVLVFDGQQVTPDPLFAKLRGTAVRSIERSANGTLWLASGRGVYVCRTGGGCVLTAAGFDARALLVGQGDKPDDANRVWCATTGAGLLKIALDEQLGPVVSQLDAEQGLPSQNVFAVLPQRNAHGDEALLIGTSRGIARYEPGPTAPTLYATSVISKRLHQSGELAAGLKLEYPQNSLLIDVAAISSRTFPELFQYGFLLSDTNGTVIKKKLSHESQFAMEGLKPGKYTVSARAFTRDLVPSVPLSFVFSVASAPFPWTSTALAVLLALALLALLWAILERARIARTSAALVGANRQLADARLELANEAERERRRIARDLHDQTLADLRHLLLLTDQISTNSSTDGNEPLDAPVLRGEIESISQEVRRICEDLSPSVLQNVGFAAALEFALAHAVEHAPPGCKFEYDFVCDDALEEQTKLATNVQMQIYRITQEAVNNVCRHAGATQVKMVVASSPDGNFALTIEDNGCDFDPDEDKKSEGRGLANMRARASLIDADISWARRLGGGTIFTLQKAVSRKDAKSQR